MWIAYYSFHCESAWLPTGLWVSGSYTAHPIHVLIARMVIFIEFTMHSPSRSPLSFISDGSFSDWWKLEHPFLKISCWPRSARLSGIMKFSQLASANLPIRKKKPETDAVGFCWPANQPISHGSPVICPTPPSLPLSLFALVQPCLVLRGSRTAERMSPFTLDWTTFHPCLLFLKTFTWDVQYCAVYYSSRLGLSLQLQNMKTPVQRPKLRMACLRLGLMGIACCVSSSQRSQSELFLSCFSSIHGLMLLLKLLGLSGKFFFCPLGWRVFFYKTECLSSTT